jgi:hypothetical protein
VVRELFYLWHPWFGQLVHVHEALAKGRDIFRCSLSGASFDRLLEVPAWMFDRSVSGYWRSPPVPHVDLASLHALARLLEGANASSQSAVMGAALISHETSRRDVHAPPVHDISVRSVLGPAAGEDSRNAAMAGGASPGANGTHRAAITARAPPSRRRPVMMHEKIGLQHLERKAILYVRQSSAHQVLHNRESSALQ